MAETPFPGALSLSSAALSRRRLLTVAAGASLAAAAPRLALAEEPPFWTNFWGLAIRGADPVAYFREGRPVDGDGAHEITWQGATWRFASADNRAAFEADPEAYAPQFGGYCAWAVSRGYLASVVPEAWDIVEGRLYLNYSTGVRRQWRADRAANIRRGEANWPAVLRA